MCDWLTITDAISRLRVQDTFLMERVVERDETTRKLVAQVNYLTALVQRWTREYPVLGKIEAKHMQTLKDRRTRAMARAAEEAKAANQLPFTPPEATDGREEEADPAGQ